jgi:hypothetical protein
MPRELTWENAGTWRIASVEDPWPGAPVQGRRGPAVGAHLQVAGGGGCRMIEPSCRNNIQTRNTCSIVLREAAHDRHLLIVLGVGFGG